MAVNEATGVRRVVLVTRAHSGCHSRADVQCDGEAIRSAIEMPNWEG